MTMTCRRLLVALVACLLVPAVANAMTYTFEGLTTGLPLGGQDGWVVHAGTLGVGTGAGINGTNVAEGTTAGTFSNASRENDGNFSFSPYTGSETQATLQFDLRPGTGPSANTFAGIGYRNTSGDFVAGPRGGLQMRPGGLAARWIKPKLGFELENFLSASDDQTDWYRMLVGMDFTANGGNGSATVSIMNLTDGEPSFRSLPNLTNINMELLDLPGTPTIWDSLWVRAHINGQIDNILVVPEPSSFLLLLPAAVGLFVRRGHKNEARLAA